jgi:hypothetical protein
MASFSFTSPVTPSADSRLSDDYLLVQQMSIAQGAVTGLSVAAAPAPLATPTCQLAILSGLAGPTPVELRVSDATPYCYNTIPLPTKGTGATEIVCCGDNPGGLNALVSTSAGVEIMTLDDAGTWSSPTPFTASSYLTAAGLDPLRMFTAVVVGLTGDGNAMMYFKGRSSGAWDARPLDFGGQLIGARCRMQVMLGTYEELGWLCFAADGQQDLRAWIGSGAGDPQPDLVRVNVVANEVLYTCAQTSSVLALVTDAGQNLWSVLMSYDMQILDLQKVGSNVQQGAGFRGDNGFARFYACDSVGNLSILVQTGYSDNHPVWASSPFPLDNDAIFVAAAKGVGGANTLGVVRVDQTTIDFLTEPSDQGFWTRVPVIGPEPTVPMNINRYRTRVALMDANGVPCSGMAVQLTPSELVCLEVGGQSVVASPAAPATLTADATGAVTFSQPAVGLTAATFTLEGEGITEALEICPYDYINANLAGEQPIFTGSTTVPPLQDGTTLRDATVSGQPLLPPTVTSQQADVVAQAINGLYTVLNGTMPCDGFSVDLSDPGNPSYQCLSSDELLELQASLPGDIWDDVDDLLGDIWHGIKQAAADVVKFTVNTAEKVISISLQIGADLIVLLTDLSLDIDPVASITPALFSWLGVPAATLLNWLKDLLPWGAIWSNMLTYNGYVVNGLGSLSTLVQQETQLSGSFFASLKDQFDHIFDQATGAIGEQTLEFPGRIAPVSSLPARLPGSDATNNWLQSKLMTHLPGSNCLINPLTPDDLITQVQTAVSNSNIQTDIQTELTNVGNTFATLWHQPNQPGDIRQILAADLLSNVKGLIDVILDSVSALAQTLLDLVNDVIQAALNTLNTPLPDIPFVSWLWDNVLRPSDSDEAMTLGKLACLLIAVPVTIASTISPVQARAAIRSVLPIKRSRRLRTGQAAPGDTDNVLLNAQFYGSWVLSGIDATNDLITAIQNMTDTKAPNPFFLIWNWVDFAANVFIQVTFWPVGPLFDFNWDWGSMTPGEKWVNGTWLAYWVPIGVDGLFTAAETVAFIVSESAWNKFSDDSDDINIWLDTVLGFMLIAPGLTGVVLEMSEKPPAADVGDLLEAVLNPLPWGTQFLLTEDWLTASEGLSAAVQMIIDWLGDFDL